MPLPTTGLSIEELLKTLEQYRQNDLKWKTGRTFGFVYDPGNDAETIGKQAYSMFLTENGLDPTSFPSLLRLENEVIGMAKNQANGDEHTIGTFTSGGTESIMLAVKSARDYARKKNPQIKTPELVLPVTAHAAFHKAAHYLGVKSVVTDVDPQSFCADVNAMRNAITDQTILLVASAPSYAHGVVDPIREIGVLAQEKNVLFHVDGCVGGWILPFFRRLGSKFPDYNFEVPGVTSMSMDLHKYAFCPKGASVVLYKKPELRRFQSYACATWTGYSVVNMAVQSSKSGGPIAAAWGVMRHLGDNGYLELARAMRDSTLKLIDGINAIDGLRVMGNPAMAVFAFTSDKADVFHIADEMKLRGWYIQPQLRRGPSKENLHLTVGPTNAPHIDNFLKDLRESVEAAKKLTVSPMAEQIAETFASMDPDSIDDATIAQMMSATGAGGNQLPGRLAEINQILNALPAALIERVLVEFFQGMFKP